MDVVQQEREKIMAYEYAVIYTATDGSNSMYDPQYDFDDPKEFAETIAKEHVFFQTNSKVQCYSIIAVEV
jgi:hypothetical protein